MFKNVIVRRPCKAMVDGITTTNCIWVNDIDLVSKGCQSTKNSIESAGYKVIEVDTSEYRKIDGGLSCLSLRV